MSDKKIIEKWDDLANKLLIGRTIKAVGYMTREEVEAHGWTTKVLVIELDNGVCLYPSMDDEGNDGGALFTSSKKEPVFPVIR